MRLWPLAHLSNLGKRIHDRQITILPRGRNNATNFTWHGRDCLLCGLGSIIRSPLPQNAQSPEEQAHRLPNCRSHQQVFQHRRLRRMNNIMVAEAAAAEPALPERPHAKFCSEFPDLSNEYLSLVHIDNQRADIELKRRKDDHANVVLEIKCKCRPGQKKGRIITKTTQLTDSGIRRLPSFLRSKARPDKRSI
jgi:hypothetical protein